MFNFFYRNLILKKSLVCFLMTAVLLISGGSVLFLPQKAQAVYPVTDYKQWIYNKVRDGWAKVKEYATAAATTSSAAIAAWEKNESWMAQITYAAAEIALRQVLAMMTNDIIDWVKNGYQGKPAFMSQNFADFAADVGNNAGGDFVSQYLGAGWLCQPFDADIKIALSPEKRFNETAKCTLKDMGKNLKNFYNDFSQGGWTEWLNLAQPKNNFYGALMLAQDEKDKKEQEAKDATEKDLAFGNGFLSIQDCTWYDAEGKEVDVNPPQKNVRGNPPLPVECWPNPDTPMFTMSGSPAPCFKKCTVKTPGSVVSEITKKSLTGDMDRLNMTLATIAGKAGSFFKPYIMAIGDAMVNQLIKQGLKELKGDGPSAEHPDQSLVIGKILPETDNLPNYIEQELPNVQTLLETLKTLEKDNNESYLTQQKIINLFEKKDQNLTSRPADILNYVNKLWPVLDGIKNWDDICVHIDDGEFKTLYDRDRYIKTLHNAIPLEELGLRKIFVSQSETPTSKTTVLKSGTAYSFSGTGLFSEVVLVLIDTKETSVTQNDVTTVTKETIPIEHYYDMIDWSVKIEGLDQLESSTDQEAIDRVKQVMEKFIDSVKTSKTQTETNITVIAPAKPFVEKYLAAANDYLSFFEQNLAKLNFDKVNAFKEGYKIDPTLLNIADPNSNLTPDGQPDFDAIFAAKEIVLLNNRAAAIAAIQKIGQPEPFESTEFKDLNQEVQDFASAIIENSGNLTQLLGDKAAADHSDLYGFTKDLSDGLFYPATLYHLCTTGTLP